MGKPPELLGQLVNYYFDDKTLASSVPLQGSRSKDKNVLDQKIVHALMGKIISTAWYPLKINNFASLECEQGGTGGYFFKPKQRACSQAGYVLKKTLRSLPCTWLKARSLDDYVNNNPRDLINAQRATNTEVIVRTWFFQLTFKANYTILFVYFHSICPKVPLALVEREQDDEPGANIRLGSYY